MNQPWFGQQPMPPGDPYVAWAQQRGWQVQQGGSMGALGMVPGVPFGDYEKKTIAYAAWGSQQGLPALALKLEHRIKTPGSSVTGVKSSVVTGHLWVAVIEVPTPVPALQVQRRQGTMTKLGSLKGWGKLFQSDGLELPGCPEMARYRIEAPNEEFARWFMTPDVFTMMLPPPYEFSRDFMLKPGMVKSEEYLFAFVGRKVVVWADSRRREAKELSGTEVLDACLTNASWLYQRVPPQAYNDPSGLEADRSAAPLQGIVSQLGAR